MSLTDNFTHRLDTFPTPVARTLLFCPLQISVTIFIRSAINFIVLKYHSKEVLPVCYLNNSSFYELYFMESQIYHKGSDKKVISGCTQVLLCSTELLLDIEHHNNEMLVLSRTIPLFVHILTNMHRGSQLYTKAILAHSSGLGFNIFLWGVLSTLSEVFKTNLVYGCTPNHKHDAKEYCRGLFILDDTHFSLSPETLFIHNV